MTPPRIEAILLAAGESRRVGYPKPLLKIDGQTFVAHLSDVLLQAVPRIIVVTGAFADRVRQAIPSDPRITMADNPDYRLGQLSSLRVGLRMVSDQADAALVHLVDHPAVTVATFRAIVAEYARAGKPIVIARYRGKRGHPVIFDRSLFDEVAQASDSEGARVVVNKDPDRVGYLDVDDAGVTLDLDTPADLERAGIRLPPAGTN
jgi:molybdenum cofactor cytidylyltransferase